MECLPDSSLFCYIESMSSGSERFQSLPSSKRASVLDAASEELARFGFHAASTNRIAAAAKISKGALFSYFPTKEELFSGVLAAQFEQIVADDPSVTATPRTGSLDGDVRALAERVERLHRQWPRLFALTEALRAPEPVIASLDAHRARYASLVDAPLRAVIEGACLPNTVTADAATELLTAVLDHLAARIARGRDAPAEDPRGSTAIVRIALAAFTG
jgi:AcrR family transcriptional regulator